MMMRCFSASILLCVVCMQSLVPQAGANSTPKGGSLQGANGCVGVCVCGCVCVGVACIGVALWTAYQELTFLIQEEEYPPSLGSLTGATTLFG
jgi:hypothetical protein